MALRTVLILGFCAVCLALARPTRAAVPALKWIDLSARIPTTTLDQVSSYPLLSFASSRGTEWLAGNPNQLFQVTSKGAVFDLTPDLKKFGFQKIRQVASDGQNWLVIGDSNPWFTQPDLAFRYDGMYWKNVSSIMTALPPQEWVGQIVGKRGLWIIPTNHSLFVWQSSLKQIANVPLPHELIRNGYQELKLYPIKKGWLTEAMVGRSRLFYFFDGQNFQNARYLLGDINQTTILGSNGASVLVLTAVATSKKVTIKALTFDGQTARALDAHFKPFLDYPNKSIRFFPEANMVWDGKNWLFFDHQKHMALFDGRAPAGILPDTRDTFVAAAYGFSGVALHVGYARNSTGLTPRLALTHE